MSARVQARLDNACMVNREAPMTRPDGLGKVVVAAPARLHLGFLDPSGSLGRRFGSLGLVIDGFETVVELAGAAAHDRSSASTPAAEAELPRARAHVDALRRATGRARPLHLHLASTLPVHAGLGSGTQLALAVGRAFCVLENLELPTARIAQLTGRGRRSGVGIAGFDQGGLLLDGGPGDDGGCAPLLSRVALPPAWRVIVALDPHVRGLSGDDEKRAIAQLPALPREIAAELCHEVLMRVLAGAAVAQFAPFAAGLARVQALLGAHFAPAQGGDAYTSAAVGRLMRFIADATGAAAGQSSWGPTGFAVLASQAEAESALVQARAHEALDPALDVRIVTPRHGGATITIA
jgi:beta-ribofuranosylaminobenzene 5'-phosphate synthase